MSRRASRRPGNSTSVALKVRQPADPVLNTGGWQGGFPAPLDPRHFVAAIEAAATGEDAGDGRPHFGIHPVGPPLCGAEPCGLSFGGRMRVRVRDTLQATGRRVDTVGMRIARTQIVVAALLLAGCATISPEPGGYEDILAIGATYPAGKLPISRINRLFGRDADAPVEVAIGHRETRTEMGEITHESIGFAYPEDRRCAMDFSDSPARFKEFMECRARFPDAVFCVIVSELVSEEITLHTILGFHVHPRHEGRGLCGRHGDRRSASSLGAADAADRLLRNAPDHGRTPYLKSSWGPTRWVEPNSTG